MIGTAFAWRRHATMRVMQPPPAIRQANQQASFPLHSNSPNDGGGGGVLDGNAVDVDGN